MDTRRVARLILLEPLHSRLPIRPQVILAEGDHVNFVIRRVSIFLQIYRYHTPVKRDALLLLHHLLKSLEENLTGRAQIKP